MDARYILSVSVGSNDRIYVTSSSTKGKVIQWSYELEGTKVFETLNPKDASYAQMASKIVTSILEVWDGEPVLNGTVKNLDFIITKTSFGWIIHLG